MADMEPLISVIVPAYNVKEYVTRSLTSLVAQTWKRLEIIVVNDGSTDGTREVIEDLKRIHSNITLINQTNSGVTQARIKGIESAKGDWIGFCDADDYVEPTMYEILITNALKYEVDISHCGYRMLVGSKVHYYYGTGKLQEEDNHTGLSGIISGRIEPGLWNKLIRKEIIEKVINTQKIDVSIRNLEDLLLNFYFFQAAHKSVYQDVCLYHYILRKGSAATTPVNVHKLKDPLKVLDIIYKNILDKKELNHICEQRILKNLILLSTTKEQADPQLIIPIKENALKRLRTMLPHIIRNNFTLKEKTIAIGVACLPKVYSIVHDFYAHLKGTDKLYIVE